MSEWAYSLELKRDISAITAQKKSITGELHDSKAFECNDKYCRIDLTCSNWGIEGAKRVYYTPSCRNNLHSIACMTISIDDEKRQIEVETEDGKKTIRKSGIISMQKAAEKARKAENTDNEEVSSGEANRARNSVRTDKEGIENRNISSLKSYVNFFYDESIDNEARVIKVNRELLSLNMLFVDTKEEVEEGKVRIFYGKVTLSTPKFNDGMILIKFTDCNKPSIYTNKSQLLKRISSGVLKKYLDKGTEAELFFRGYIKNGKFESFNRKYYCDLYIKE